VSDHYEEHIAKLLDFVFGDEAELQVNLIPENMNARRVGSTIVPVRTLQSWSNRSWIEFAGSGDITHARITDSGEAAAAAQWGQSRGV